MSWHIIAFSNTKLRTCLAILIDLYYFCSTQDSFCTDILRQPFDGVQH